MLRSRALFFAGVLSLVSIFVAPETWGRSKPQLPEAEIHKSSLKSATAAMGKMYFSEKEYVVAPQHFDVAESGADLNAQERDRIHEFCADKETAASKKMLYIARYGLGQKDMTDVILFCKEKGVRIQLTTDLNRALVAQLKDGEKYTFDFAGSPFLAQTDGDLNPMALAIKTLLDAGFTYNGTDWGIFSQALYPADDDAMKPIMHEKAVVAWIEDKPARSWLSLSTANWATGSRVNRLFFLQEPVLTEIYQKHLESLNAGFASEKTIPDASESEKLRHRIEYPDGTAIDVAFTGGEFNPNDRIQQLYEAGSNGDLVIEEIYLSEFVFTNKNVFDSILNYMAKSQETQLFGVFEDRFIDLNGWGLAAAMGGFDVYRPFGPAINAVKSKLLRQMTVYGYQREARDPSTGEALIEKSEEGAPIGRYLWHDKTHVAKVRKGDKVYYVVHTGSFNLSNHVENSEVQLEIWLPEESPMAQSIVQSIRMTAEAHTEWALPMKIVVARKAIGRITGHTGLEIPVDVIKKFIKAALDQDDKALIAELQVISELPSNLSKRPSPGEVADRIKKITKFIKWYRGLKLSDFSETYIARRFLALSVVLTQEKLAGYQAKRIIKGIIWRPSDKQDAESKAKQEALDDKRAIAGLKILGIETGSAERVMKLKKSVGIIADLGTAERAPKLDFYNFDWDDNLINMTKTSIVLFDKKTGQERNVSTADFAAIREAIGVEGTLWKNYTLRNNPDTGSFRNFRSTGGQNALLRDLQETVAANAPAVWKGPSFSSFVTALSDPERAKRVFIPTARGHSKADFMDALKFLQDYVRDEDGVQIYLPPEENIIAVGATPGDEDTSVKKWNALKAQLDQIQASAEKLGDTVRWGYSDDDAKNFSVVKQSIEAARAVETKKWDKVKLVLFYTGKDDARAPRDIEVFDPGVAQARAPKMLMTNCETGAAS